MLKQFCSVLLCFCTLSLFVIEKLKAQMDIDVIYQNGTSVFDATYDNMGSYYVAGSNNYYPRLIKLNPSGDVVFDKIYDLSGWWNNYSQFLKIICDSSNNLYAFGSYDNSIGGFVCKIDTNGNFIWFTDSVMATQTNKDAHLKTFDNKVYLINGVRKELAGPNFNAAFMQTFNSANGDLLRQDTLCDLSQFPLTKCTYGRSSINSYDYLKTYSVGAEGDVLSIDTNANIEVISIENVDPNELKTFPTLLAASLNHYYLLRYEIVGEYLDTELYLPKVVKYDTNWEKLEEAEMDMTANYILSEKLMQGFSAACFHEDYGIIAAGSYAPPAEPFVPREGFNCFVQFDHRTMRPIKVQRGIEAFSGPQSIEITNDGLVRSTHQTNTNSTGTSVVVFQLEPLWPLSVDEEGTLKQSSIYPNPSAQNQLQLASDVSVVTLNIYGINGSLVYSKQIARPSYSLDISTLQSGVYIVELTLRNGNTDIHKLIRQ